MACRTGAKKSVVVLQCRFNVRESRFASAILLGSITSAFEGLNHSTGLFFFRPKSVSSQELPASRVAFREMSASNFEHVFARVFSCQPDAPIEPAFELFIRPLRLVHIN